MFLAAHLPALRQLHSAAGLVNTGLLTSYLQEHDLVIVCGRDRWTLQINDNVVAEAPPPHMTRVPSQPTPRPRRETHP